MRSWLPPTVLILVQHLLENYLLYLSSLQDHLSQGDVDRIVASVSKCFNKLGRKPCGGSTYDSKPHKRRKLDFYGPETGDDSDEYDSESDFTDDYYSDEGSSDEEFDDYVPAKVSVV